MKNYGYELGGFCEGPEDIDGDWEAYNHCLADEYIGALYNEDFDSVGYISLDLLKDIYNNSYEKVPGILDGSMMTCKDRTLIDAILANRYGTLADLYLKMGIFSPKLVVAILLSDEDIEPEAILSLNQSISTITQEEFDKRLKELFDFIQKIYDSNKDDNILLTIKEHYGRMSADRDLKHNVKPHEYGWYKRIKEILK